MTDTKNEKSATLRIVFPSVFAQIVGHLQSIVPTSPQQQERRPTAVRSASGLVLNVGATSGKHPLKLTT
jgi:hypothetical protein